MENSLAEKLIQDPLMREMLSPRFIDYPEELRKSIYANVPDLKEKNILLSTLEDLSRVKKETSPQNIERLLEDVAQRYLSSQQEDGSWHLLTRDEAGEFNGHLKEKLEKDYSPEDRMPNVWSNCLVSLFLMKWRRHLEKDKILSAATDRQIIYTLNKSAAWIKNACELGDGTYGCSPAPPQLEKKFVIYDSSLALITLAYDPALLAESKPFAVELFHNIIKEGIISGITNSIDKELPPDDKNMEDIGAASYFIVSAIKCMEHNLLDIKRQQLEPYVRIIAEAQNFPSGGWGRYKGNKEDDIDKTCYALLALNKWSNYYKTTEFKDRIGYGVRHVKNKISQFDGIPPIICWSRVEDRRKGCLKISSLTISTLLRCGVKAYDHRIQIGLEGSYMLWKRGDINEVEKAYFNCMLIDYLKFGGIHASQI